MPHNSADNANAADKTLDIPVDDVADDMPEDTPDDVQVCAIWNRIATAILSMGRGLNVRVAAVGVETEAVPAFLKANHFDGAQATISAQRCRRRSSPG
jgi:EAL domain-containing protein (putative c-di-GMP-specific phosphodiesterase class I)